MFIRQFEYLIALEKERHFGRAAESCHVSQPSLSSGINQLEEELGVRIILRHHRFMGFTQEGERVIEWSKRLLADQKGMVDDLAIMRNNLSGSLRIGAMPMSSPVLPIINNIFSEQFPYIKFNIQFLGSDTLIKQLNNFEIDVGITYIEEVKKNRYQKTNGLLPKHQTHISWKEASELPLCMLSPFMKEREVMDQAFDHVDCKPEPKLECNSIFQLAFHVMHGKIATVVPSGFCSANDAFPGTREIQLIDPLISKPVGLIWEKVTPPLSMPNALSDVLIKAKDEIHEAMNF